MLGFYQSATLLDLKHFGCWAIRFSKLYVTLWMVCQHEIVLNPLESVLSWNTFVHSVSNLIISSIISLILYSTFYLFIHLLICLFNNFVFIIDYWFIDWFIICYFFISFLFVDLCLPSLICSLKLGKLLVSLLHYSYRCVVPCAGGFHVGSFYFIQYST